MKSKTILTIHTLLFFSFVAVSLSLSMILFWYPGAVPGKIVVIGYSILAILVIGSWPTFGGCPFTVWENNFRKREGRKVYSGACINHYAKEWFGIILPSKFGTYLLIALLVLPIIFGFIHW
jgi:hypothetical protein